MNKAQADQLAAEDYLRSNKIHHLLNDLVCELVKEKPKDPLAHLMTHLPKMKPSQAGEKAAVEGQYPRELDEKALTIVVLGASGDLAKKKTFPALYQLYCQGLLPKNVSIVGYARTQMSDTQLCSTIEPTLSKVWQASIKEKFFVQCSYVAGNYNEDAAFANLDARLKELEARRGGPSANRLFYLALPPAVFLETCSCLKKTCMDQATGWSRVIIEKPFGRDTESSALLTKNLSSVLTEQQMWRIDHYLGKEMVQNLITLRFANKVFNNVWDKNSIANVQITFKETIGTMGRGGYFDSSGIIRDVLQNHILQVMALVAMEKPKSLDPEAVRDEKVSVLKQVRPATLEEAVLGQYTASPDGKEPGYLDDKTVPEGSNTPTFAQTILWVDNDRWDGVPFILKAAKAVERKEVTIRIQFKPEIRPFRDGIDRNELVVRLQPNEAMYVKINAKDPGMASTVHTTELDLTYNQRYNVLLPDAYESLIYDAVAGNATNFVRSDELDAAWRVYTPLLHSIESGHIKSVPYPFGSRGPPAADEAKYKHYQRDTSYKWEQRQNKL